MTRSCSYQCIYYNAMNMLSNSTLEWNKMKHIYIVNIFLSLSCVAINCNLIHCQQNGTWLTTTQTSLVNYGQCPLWFFFNTTTEQCECYTNPSTTGIVKCEKQEAQLRVGYCMTYEDGEGIYVAPCFYFQGDTHTFKTTDDYNYITLPKDISQLNDYMCGPMNRKGRVCSECIDGFGPSVISVGSICSNCTDAWYGIPLYLFLEFVPITVFYVVIVFFRINVTSAPMVAFVFFSQTGVSTINSYAWIILFKSSITYNFLRVLTTFYGFWNLDFFRHILPPFCISPKLKLIHITFLNYVSAFYPLVLICITCICIELHFRDFKLIVWLWSKLTSCYSKCTNTTLDYSNSMIHVFATFFLLSYTKIMFTGFSLLTPTRALIINNYSLYMDQFTEADPSIGYFNNKHLPFVIVSIFILLFAILPPLLLLILYPVKAFRSLLFKFHLSTRTIASLNIFVEKYYSCYRDGIDGGKDLRSMVSVYFLLRLLAQLLISFTFYRTVFTFSAILYGGCGLMIALVCPYKKAYMNIIDSLIFGFMTLISLMLSNYYEQESSDFLSLFYALVGSIFSSLPLLALAGFIAYKILKGPVKKLMKKIHTPFYTRLLCFKNVHSHREPEAVNEGRVQQENVDDGNNFELPDRVLHPEQYHGEMQEVHKGITVCVKLNTSHA